MSKRAHINLSTKLAAALLRLGEIDYERSKTMTVKQINACYHFDHDPIPKALGGSDHPSNLTPRLVAEHKHKTIKDNGTGRSDITAISRLRRIMRKRSNPKPKHKIARHVDPWGKKFKARRR